MKSATISFGKAALLLLLSPALGVAEEGCAHLDRDRLVGREGPACTHVIYGGGAGILTECNPSARVAFEAREGSVTLVDSSGAAPRMYSLAPIDTPNDVQIASKDAAVARIQQDLVGLTGCLADSACPMVSADGPFIEAVQVAGSAAYLTSIPLGFVAAERDTTSQSPFASIIKETLSDGTAPPASWLHIVRVGPDAFGLYRAGPGIAPLPSVTSISLGEATPLCLK